MRGILPILEELFQYGDCFFCSSLNDFSSLEGKYPLVFTNISIWLTIPILRE